MTFNDTNVTETDTNVSESDNVFERSKEAIMLPILNLARRIV